MKTIQIATGRILAVATMITLFTANLSARVYVYQNNNYSGSWILLSEGEYKGNHFNRLFQGDYGVGKACSVKVPNGWVVEVDYYGYGFEDPRTKAHHQDIKTLGRGFAQIRIRKPSGGGGGLPGGCDPSTAITFYDGVGYKGNKTCFAPGIHRFQSKRIPRSIKVKPGYLIILFNRGREFRRISRNSGDIGGYHFDRIKIEKARTSTPSRPGRPTDPLVGRPDDPSIGRPSKPTKPSKPAPTDPINGRPDPSTGKSECGSDWRVQFYTSSAYNGKNTCFASGQHRINNKSLRVPGSIKIKPGYFIIMYKGGREIQRLSNSSTSFKGRHFDSFKVISKGNRGSGRDGVKRGRTGKNRSRSTRRF